MGGSSPGGQNCWSSTGSCAKRGLSHHLAWTLQPPQKQRFVVLVTVSSAQHRCSLACHKKPEDLSSSSCQLHNCLQQGEQSHPDCPSQVYCHYYCNSVRVVADTAERNSPFNKLPSKFACTPPILLPFSFTIMQLLIPLACCKNDLIVFEMEWRDSQASH